MLITGPLMFSADAVPITTIRRFNSRWCACRWLCCSISRSIAGRRGPGVAPLAAKLAGGVSLLLWTAVVAGGRMIAFV